MQLLHRGNKARTMEPTAANKTSSRSHALLSVTVRQSSHSIQDGEQHLRNRVKQGKLFMIDLAGSERAKQTKVKQSRSALFSSIFLTLRSTYVIRRYRTKARDSRKGRTSTDLSWHWAIASMLCPAERDTSITAIPSSPDYWRTLLAGTAERSWLPMCRRRARSGTKARIPWSTRIAPIKSPTRSRGTSWTSVTCTSHSIAT